MKYVIDAKIEKGQPRLRVLDADTGAVHMEWSLTRVNKMLEEGEIPQKDFLHPERYGMKLLIRNLFLLSCIESLNDCDDEYANEYETTDSNVNNVVPMKDLKKKSKTDHAEWYFGIRAFPV